jgi:protoporphyrinogen oxidase
LRTVIIGAGFAGLSAGHKLKKDYLILEKEKAPGGLCRTNIVKGFAFDYTGHFLHLRKPAVEKFIRGCVKVKLEKVARKAFIHTDGVYTGYPYQVNNYGLPGEIVAENVIGFLRAKFAGEASQKNFKEWVITALGDGIAKNFMLPYNSKLLKHPLDKLTIKWLGRFVPNPTIQEIMRGILPRGKAEMGYNASFYYPASGGIESVIKGIYEKIKGNVRLDSSVKKIDANNRVLYYEGGSERYDKLISTMPLPGLIRAAGIKELLPLAEKLKATSVYSLNLGFKSGGKIDKHWVYVPEAKYPFYRIGFPSEVVAGNAPAGYSSVFTEVSFHGKPPRSIDNAIIKGLVDMGVIASKKDIVVRLPLVLKDAYVIYDREREEVMPKIMRTLNALGIYTAGRWGNWEYSSMEDAIIEGFEAAELVK